MPWRGVLLVWALVAALMVIMSLGHLNPAAFADGDDALRLQQVRDLLAGQGWFDLHQYRIALPEGVAMHWTRVVDLPIAAVVLLLRPLLGQAQAEIVAIVAVPLLTMLAAMALAARLAARRFGSRAGVAAALMVAVSIPASFRMMPLRIDHHAWQFVLALVAMNGLCARAPRTGGAVAGAALALALSISLESLPLATIVAAVCTLRLWRGRADWLVGYMASLSLGCAVLFLASRGLGDLGEHCDALSPVHVLALLWVGTCVTLILPRLRNRPPALSLVALGLIGLGALAIALAAAPQCLTGDAFAELDPLVRRVWLESVTEGLPVWRQSAGFAATMIALPLFGLIASARLRGQARDTGSRELWLDYALLLAGATVVGLLVARASAVACLFAAVPAAWQVEEQFSRWEEEPLLFRRLGRMMLILVLLMPGAVVGAAGRAVALKGEDPEVAPAAECDFASAAPALAALPQTTVLTGLDIGPTVLVTTPHSVVATAHHRASAAMRDVIDAFLGSDDRARAVMERRGALVVAVCPSGNEAATYAAMAPRGFMAHLVQGRAPDWLEPLAMPGESGIKAWRIRAR